MIDTTTARLAKRSMTGHRLADLAARQHPPRPPAMPAVRYCQALVLAWGPHRNLPTSPATALDDDYDRCHSRATHQVIARCAHGHVITWHVCIECAGIIARQASRRHPHCPRCRQACITSPVAITITPPVTHEPPSADHGCERDGCPDRGSFWACHHCGDAYIGTPPDHGLCPDCATTDSTN